MEWSTIEYKRGLTKDVDGLEREVVSFLNTNGGELFIGMNDDGTIYGVEDVDSVQTKIVQRLDSNIQPSCLGSLFHVRGILQYVPDPVLLAPNVRAQLRLVSGFGADKEPLVIYAVKFVGQQHLIYYLQSTIYYLPFTIYEVKQTRR